MQGGVGGVWWARFARARDRHLAQQRGRRLLGTGRGARLGLEDLDRHEGAAPVSLPHGRHAALGHLPYEAERVELRLPPLLGPPGHRAAHGGAVWGAAPTTAAAAGVASPAPLHVLEVGARGRRVHRRSLLVPDGMGPTEWRAPALLEMHRLGLAQRARGERSEHRGGARCIRRWPRPAEAERTVSLSRPPADLLRTLQTSCRLDPPSRHGLARGEGAARGGGAAVAGRAGRRRRARGRAVQRHGGEGAIDVLHKVVHGHQPGRVLGVHGLCRRLEPEGIDREAVARREDRRVEYVEAACREERRDRTERAHPDQGQGQGWVARAGAGLPCGLVCGARRRQPRGGLCVRTAHACPASGAAHLLRWTTWKRACTWWSAKDHLALTESSPLPDSRSSWSISA